MDEQREPTIQHLIHAVNTHGKKIIYANNTIIGICECEGEGGSVRISDAGFAECDGKGTCKKWIDQDPCGRSLYDHFDCPNAKPIPKPFLDEGAGI